MLSSLYRSLIRVTEKVHHPKRSRALVLSRRTFTRALALVAFGGVARPPSPRVLPSGDCECDSDGQCTGSCEPNSGPCEYYRKLPDAVSPAGFNCWCQAIGSGVIAHVCDCYCPDAEEEEWVYCTCRTIGYTGCGGVGFPGDSEELI